MARALPGLKAAEQIASDYETRFHRLAALALILNLRWGTASPFRRDLESPAGASDFARRVTKLAIPAPTDAALADATREWLAAAAELANEETTGE